MAAASYSKSQLVEIMRNALALALRRGGLENGEAADRMLDEGFDLDTAYAALRGHLHHSGAQSRLPVAPFEWLARVKADVLAILRAALTPTGPFIITIPALSGRYHIRLRDYDFGTQIKSGIEIVTDNGILPGSNVVMRLRPTKHPGGRPEIVPEQLIGQLDQKACSSLAANGTPLYKKTRADLILT